MFLISAQKHTLKNIPLGWHHFWGSELNKEQAALWIVFTVKGGWIRHLLSLSSCFALKGDLLKVCGWVLMWSTFGLLAYLCVCSVMPTSYITLLHLQADFYLSISLGDSLAWHPRLSISTWQQLESNLETCHSFLMRRYYKAQFSPNLRHRVASLFLMTSDIFFCYLFSESDAMMCLWVGQLSRGPSLALVHVIRPYMEWHLAWPCGAPSGSSELICSQPRMPDIWSQTC